MSILIYMKLNFHKIHCIASDCCSHSLSLPLCVCVWLDMHIHKVPLIACAWNSHWTFYKMIYSLPRISRTLLIKMNGLHFHWFHYIKTNAIENGTALDLCSPSIRKRVCVFFSFIQLKSSFNFNVYVFAWYFIEFMFPVEHFRRIDAPSMPLKEANVRFHSYRYRNSFEFLIDLMNQHV